ncbi:MAG: hypothetical protein L3K10_03010 [Thermoplasmata archaeon]|nr:hypothetical protein [Thermoplasmata archaeon]
MTKSRNRTAGVALASVVATFALAMLLAVPNAGASLVTNSPGMMASPPLTPQPTPHHLLSDAEQMPAFLNGSIVNTIYLQGNFVGTLNAKNSTFGMEPMAGEPAIGVTPTVYPTARANIPAFTVLVPWWGPTATPYAPAYNPAAYGIHEMCAPATVAVCWDHPATINVPGLGTVPLPGHDHLIGTAAGNKDTWWNLKVVLVFESKYWPGLNGGRSHGITSIGALTAAQAVGAVSATLGTNDFLNFAVASPSGAYNPTQPPASRTLQLSEQMPAFLKGRVVNTLYENGYFTSSNAPRMGTFGMEPLLSQAGVGAPDIHDPISNANEPAFIVLVPWWGPASAPYAPAYNPAAYGIKLMCAPDSIALCYDHPATIDVPGLGVVPLPGHDHLITEAFHHTDTWWSLIVVLVTDPSVFPNLAGTHGITSLASLTAAQAAGQASADLGTNTYLNFEVV